MADDEEVNPYFDPDLDDDIDSGPIHPVDGSICPSCGIVHNIVAEDGDDIPAAVRRKVARQLSSMPSDIARGATNILVSKVSAVKGFKEGYNTFFEDYIDKPNIVPEAVIGSMAKVLDELTGGKVTERFVVAKAEAMLVRAMLVRRILTGFLEFNSHYPKRSETTFSEVVEFVEEKIAEVSERIDRLCSEYKDQSSRLGIEVDQSIVETGLPAVDLFNIYGPEAKLYTVIADAITAAAKAEEERNSTDVDI